MSSNQLYSESKDFLYKLNQPINEDLSESFKSLNLESSKISKRWIESQTNTQIDLSKKLVEAVGVEIDGKQPIRNKQLILELIRQGATPRLDLVKGSNGRVVEGYSFNVLELIGWTAKSDQDIELFQILLDTFPSYIRQESQYDPSLLSSIFTRNTEKSKTLYKKVLQDKLVKNPVWAFLQSSGFYQEIRKETKLDQLKAIAENYNIAKVIKTDLMMIRKFGHFRDPNVRKNLPIMMEFLTANHGRDFIRNCLGGTYGITEPITWFYIHNTKRFWMVESFSSQNIAGVIKIEKEQNRIKVKCFTLLQKTVLKINEYFYNTIFILKN